MAEKIGLLVEQAAGHRQAVLHMAAA